MKKHPWLFILIGAVVLVVIFLLIGKKASAQKAAAQPSEAQIQANLQSLGDAFANSPYQSAASANPANATDSNAVTDNWFTDWAASWYNKFFVPNNLITPTSTTTM